jgi:hypothetical protein
MVDRSYRFAVSSPGPLLTRRVGAHSGGKIAAKNRGQFLSSPAEQKKIGQPATVMAPARWRSPP